MLIEHAGHQQDEPLPEKQGLEKDQSNYPVAILPLEKLIAMSHQLPESLLGYWGKNRLDSTPQIGANHDLEAIQSWLNEYKDSPETLRSYKREAERLILWCWQQQGRALSDLNRQDIADYQIFFS